MSTPADRFVTALGCTLSMSAPPDHLGPGAMLRLYMNQPGDNRFAEVYLNLDEIDSLVQLCKWARGWAYAEADSVTTERED